MINTTEIANELGQKAFGNGLHVPAQDKEMMDMFTGIPVGGCGMQLMASWKNGWNKARESTDEYKQMMKDVFVVD